MSWRIYWKDGHESAASIIYQIKFIDRNRFLASSSSNNFAEGIHKIKFKVCACALECKSVNNNLYTNKIQMLIL